MPHQLSKKLICPKGYRFAYRLTTTRGARLALKVASQRWRECAVRRQAQTKALAACNARVLLLSQNAKAKLFSRRSLGDDDLRGRAALQVQLVRSAICNQFMS
ncbi:MAG: hypothetical protein AAF652_19770 [Cyanobacteria bacterium P01_C01_bin.72]